MFVLDIETLDTKETAAILSIGMVYADQTGEYDVALLRTQSMFVKCDARDQVKNKGRTISQSTLDFWAKQDNEVKNKNYHPRPDDLNMEACLRRVNSFINHHAKVKNEIIFTRGTLDSICIASAAEQYGVVMAFKFWNVRDVRTAVDILANSSNGYCEVTQSLEGLNKHNPDDDCIIDAIMLRYYIEKPL